jgi:hypothetical protein
MERKRRRNNLISIHYIGLFVFGLEEACAQRIVGLMGRKAEAIKDVAAC